MWERLYSDGKYIDYLPAQPGTDSLALSVEEQQELISFAEAMRKKHSAIFLDFPGDEYELGECLSAGRGFIHISAEGNVEPCPFSPYSDSNLRSKSLEESLQSTLFTTLRNNPKELQDAGGSCALFANRELVEELVAGVGWGEVVMGVFVFIYFRKMVF